MENQITLTKEQQSFITTRMNTLEHYEKKESSTFLSGLYSEIINGKLIEFCIFTSSNKVTKPIVDRLYTTYKWLKTIKPALNGTQDLGILDTIIEVTYSIIDTVCPNKYIRNSYKELEFLKEPRNSSSYIATNTVIYYGRPYKITADNKEGMIVEPLSDDGIIPITTVGSKDTARNIRVNCFLLDPESEINKSFFKVITVKDVDKEVAAPRLMNFGNIVAGNAPRPRQVERDPFDGMAPDMYQRVMELEENDPLFRGSLNEIANMNTVIRVVEGVTYTYIGAGIPANIIIHGGDLLIEYQHVFYTIDDIVLDNALVLFVASMRGNPGQKILFSANFIQRNNRVMLNRFKQWYINYLDEEVAMFEDEPMMEGDDIEEVA